MRVELANQLFLSQAVAGGIEYSQPVAINGMTGVRLDFAVISANGSLSTVSAEVLVSDDVFNWDAAAVTTAASVAATNVPSKAAPVNNGTTLLTGSYARVRYTITGANARACVNCSITFFQMP
jgi:hypothetical protein